MKSVEVAAFIIPTEDTISSRQCETSLSSLVEGELKSSDATDDCSTTSSFSSLKQLDHARYWIYVSHFFAQFSDEAWQFSLSLFLAAFSNYQSLFLVCSYGIVSQLSICAFGSTSGRFVDETSSNRLRTARIFLGTQSLCVLIATACSYYALQRVHEMMLASQPTRRATGSSPAEMDGESIEGDTEDQASFAWSEDSVTVILVILIHFFGPLAELASQGFLVAMERDWIVAMVPATTAPLQDENDQTVASVGTPTEYGTASTGRVITGREWLAETNVRMKQLVLTCKVVAPAVAGWVVGVFDRNANASENDTSNHHSASTEAATDTHDSSSHNLTTAALLVGLVNVTAVAVEYLATARVYYMVPALHRPASASSPSHSTLVSPSTIELPTVQESQQSGGEGAIDSSESLRLNDDESIEDKPGSAKHEVLGDMGARSDAIAMTNDPEVTDKTSLSSCRFLLPSGWTVYFQQPIAYGGLGLALLYVNILTFSALMTAFLVSRGMALATVGLLRGISAALGLLGTMAYHVSVKSTSLVTTGLWSIVFEFMCLSVCFASFFVPSYIGSIRLLVGGVLASRIGLWVFDISVTQMMQEFIPEGIRGVVGGTQQSLNALFQFIPNVMGLVFYKPSEFYVYGATGYLAVGIAMVLYFVGVYQRAKRLFPEAGGGSYSLPGEV